MTLKQTALLGGAIALFVGSALWHREAERSETWREGTEHSPSTIRQASVPPYYADIRGVQGPKPLPPDQFTGLKTRESYRVAGEIPEALMQLPCYCWCDRVGHKSLLSCFVDDHGEFCAICQDSALWAHRRLREQASIPAIRQEIIEHYEREYGTR